MSELAYKIKHPAILKVEVKENHEGIWVTKEVLDNLSSLAEHRLTNVLTVTITPPGAIDVTTLAGVLFTKLIGAIKGVVPPMEQSFVFAYGDTSQSIPNDQYTLLEINAIVTDLLGEFDTNTHRFTAKNDGIYLIIWTGNVFYDIDAEQASSAQLWLNGSMLMEAVLFSAISYASVIVNGAGITALNAGDYLEVIQYQNSGNTQQSAGSITTMKLQVFRLA